MHQEDTSGSLEWTALVIAVAMMHTRWQCLVVISQEESDLMEKRAEHVCEGSSNKISRGI